MFLSNFSQLCNLLVSHLLTDIVVKVLLVTNNTIIRLLIFQGANNIANLTMDRFVVNPTSCHSTTFKYTLAGNNPGSLSLILQSEERVNVRVLWTTSQTTNGWTSVSLTFRYWGRFFVSTCS